MTRTALRTIAAIVAMVPALAGAQIVFDNGTPNNAGGNEMTRWVQAEDFSLTQTTTITGIRFWAFQERQNAYQGAIAWSIYGDASGSPGAVQWAGTFYGSFVNQGPSAFGEEDQLQFDIATDFVLGAGSYWLGLHNGPLTTTTDEAFFWQTRESNSTLAGQEDVVPFGDGGWAESGVEHAFQLLGRPSTVVPEPSTYALLATGLVAIVVVSRRRRNA